MKKILLLFVILTSVDIYAQIPTNGLISEHKFSNGSLEDGVGAEDFVQTGSLLTSEIDRASGANRSVSLNGDYLQKPTDGTGNFDLSVSFWVKTSTNDVNKRVIIDQTERTTEAETSSQTGWYAYLKDGRVGVAGNFQWAKQVVNIVSGTVYEATGFMGYLGVISTTDISDGNWHHVAITVFTNGGQRQNGTQIKATYKVYVDNVLEASNDQIYNAPNHSWSVVKRFVNLTHPVSVGNSKDGNSTNVFQEGIDDIRFYSRTLSDIEVTALQAEQGCSGSTSVSALAQDISVALGANGSVDVLPSDVDNGSVNSCNEPAFLSLDLSTFTCDDLGDNVVTLSTSDGDGNTNSITATVTITPYISILAHTAAIVLPVDANGDLILTPADVDNGTTTSCGAGHLTLSLDRTAFDCTDVGSNITVTLTATDNYGNFEAVTATVRAEDSTAPVAIAQDIIAVLDAQSGNVTITPAMVSNGSSDNCTANLSLSKTQFSCGDVGENIVTLTVSDNRANVSTATAVVTVMSPLEVGVSSTAANFCADGNIGAIISTDGSSVGVDYFLRNSANNAIVEGPIAGTGSVIDFAELFPSETATYNVYAEPISQTGFHALDFDGVNDYVSLGTGDRGVSTQITVAAWIKSTDSGAIKYIVSKYNGASGYILFFTAEGKMRFDGRDAVGVYRSSGIGTTSVNDGEWHYVAGTANISTGLWSVYVDGVLESGVVNGAGATMGNSTNLTIASYITDYSAVTIDQVTIWNTALDASSIQSNYGACLTGSESGVVGHFNFNEGSGALIADASALGLNGTLENMDASTDWISGVSPSCSSGCGAQMSTEITLGDSTAPVISVEDITLQLGINGIASIVSSDVLLSVSDNCTANEDLISIIDVSEFGCDKLGANTVTLTMTDLNGNESIETLTVTVEDVMDPVAVGQNITIQLDVNNMATISTDDINDGSSDNCGIASLALSKYDFTEVDLGANQVDLTVTDASGNSNVVLVNVTVQAYKLAQSITFNAITDRTYGDAGFDLSATSDSGLLVEYAVVNGPVSLSGNSLTITGAGEVTIEVSQSGNDDFLEAESVLQSFTINKAVVTATADNQSINYGDAIPALTISYSGFVNGEDETALVTIPTISTSAASGSGAGTYDILLSDGQNLMSAVGPAPDNYTLVMNNGLLTISKIPLTITADSYEITYGDAIPALTYAITGFVNGEGEGNLSTSIGVSTSATSLSDVGTYAIEMTTGGSDAFSKAFAFVGNEVQDNYEYTLVNGVLTIGKANQSLSLDGVADKFGDDEPVSIVALSSSGLVVSLAVEGPATLTGNTLSLTGGAGLVTVTASQLGDVNYHAAESISTSFEVFAPCSTLSVQVTLDGNTVTAVASGGNSAYEFSIDGTVFNTESVFTNLSPGFYTITVQDAVGCSIQSQTVEVIVSGLGDQQLTYKFYPNPVQDYLRTENITSMVLYDILGHVVLRSNTASSIDLRNLESGVYLMNALTHDGRTISERLVKR